MATLEVRALTTTPQPGGRTLHDVSFAVEDGHVTAVLLAEDTSADGLVRTISGLEAPYAGDVLLGGVSVLGLPTHRRGIGLVFEDAALFPDRDAWDNVAFGLRMGRWPKAGREARVAELLDLVDLANRGGARVDALTEDERRRLALARALAPEPAALLLEEPLRSLDGAALADSRARLRSLLERVRITTLVATHSLQDAVALADSVVVVAHGRVLQAGILAEVLGAPVTAEVATLAGYQVLADGPIEEGHVVERGAGGIALPSGAAFSGSATVMAHPSTVLAVPGGAGLGCGVRGFVHRTRPEGPAAVLEVDLGARTVDARWEWDLLPPPLGTPVEIAVRPGTLRFFGTPAASEDAPPAVADMEPADEPGPRPVPAGAAPEPGPPGPERASVRPAPPSLLRERGERPVLTAPVPASTVVATNGAARRTRTARERVLDPLITKNGNGNTFPRPPMRERVPDQAPGAVGVERVVRHPDMPSFD